MRNPSKPTEVGRWWLPGTRKGDNEPPPARHQKPALDKGNRAHNTNVYPQRPDRLYLAYLDAGMFIMDISDKSKPKPICRFDNSPPYTGFTHTIVPLFERGLVVMTDEFDLRQRRRLAEADLDPRRPRREQPGPDLDLPDAEPGRLQDPRRPLRRAQHPREHAAARAPGSRTRSSSARSSTAGLRAYDISNAYQPKEVATFVPPGPALSKYASIQLNDVFVDEREIVYTVDRFSGGLYILEMDF